MTRWVKAHWEEEDILYFFELDETGSVFRHIELSGPDRTPTAAAALSEIPDVRTAGLAAVQAYEQRFGMLDDASPITEWDDSFVPEEIAATDFEAAWVSARAHLQTRVR